MDPRTRTRTGAGLLRRVVPGLVALSLGAAACGTKQAATVRMAPEEDRSSDTIGALDATGADLEEEALSRIGFDAAAHSDVPEIESPLDAASLQASSSGDALLEGVVEALASNDLDRAATFTTGEAKKFLFYLSSAQECGFEFTTARTNGIQGDAELGPVGRLVLPVDATLVLDSGLERNIEAIQIEDQKRAGWLISDLLIDGRTADDLTVDLDSTVRADIRLTPERQCTGPTTIEARYELFNEGRDPFLPEEIYFLDAAGTRHEIPGVEEALDEPVPGRSNGGRFWEFALEVPNGYDGGEFVVVATDLDESRQEDTAVLVTREYPVFPSPFFSDFDPQAAAIDEALGRVADPTDSTSESTTSTPEPTTSDTTAPDAPTETTGG